MKVWWGVASISKTDNLHLLTQLEGEDRSTWKPNTLDGKADVHREVPVDSLHLLTICQNTPVLSSLGSSHLRHNEPADAVSVPGTDSVA